MHSRDHQEDVAPAANPAMQQVHFLYSDHHNWLYGWLRFRLGDATDAADLAHDTFVRLIARPRCFDSSQEARAYLRTIANGLCIDLWRHREIERAWLETLATQPEAYAPSAEEQTAVLQALHEIDGMLRHLPLKAARAFVLAMACGMTHQEVARELGVSSRMVGHYITQAMLHCMQLEARNLGQAGAIAP
ncbi:MAG: putative RNA polymerase sigma factor FecI [Nitrosomonas europaea]|uniref:sigma-70 family RNA polymerase sigma factor n=1 Tax=Nitrosomonas TaxID=914 RepID=UPI0023F4599A|nr:MULTISPECIES: sigma-70 family RNA polymerase sigma factor [Nitrosomonas]MBV6388930.1 putative RNA polymerase sigma factor FecI [Nitrosomonas europaea]